MQKSRQDDKNLILLRPQYFKPINQLMAVGNAEAIEQAPQANTRITLQTGLTGNKQNRGRQF